jgi:hypothetical protein
MNAHGMEAQNPSDWKQSIPASPPLDHIIPPRGDYQTLHSFHKAEVIYDTTFHLGHKFLTRGGRTVDQMIQAVR